MSRVEEIAHREVPPDPSIADAVGRHHTLGTAIADLVDNSIDARAGRVHIRFLSTAGAVHGLRVLDDGTGMDALAIDAAMTFAGKRDYEAGDLGHFGLGLKAASLSQADLLDVYSRATGSAPVGRRIAAERPTRVSELDPSQVADVFAERAAAIPGGPSGKGTVVEWRGVRTFLSSPHADERAAWLTETIEELRAHLGLVLHRLLAAGGPTITIDEFDTDIGVAGPSRAVEPIDPFGYVPGRAADVFELDSEIEGLPIRLRGHIWPAGQSGSPLFRLGGRPGEKWQGFHIYRNDRLLQVGGWNGIVHGSRALNQARVEIDLDDVIGRHTTINPEKSGVEFDADLREALHRAADPRGRTFRDYLAAAEHESALSRQRSRRPITLVEPRRGFSAGLLDTIGDTVMFSEHGSIEIRWRTLRSGTLTDVDLEKRTLWVNSRYRHVLGIDTGAADDAPLFKMLLLLLYSRFFEGTMLGVREKDELQTWDELIVAALDEELEQREYGKDLSDG